MGNRINEYTRTQEKANMSRIPNKTLNGMPANTPEEVEKAVDAALMGGRFAVIALDKQYGKKSA